MTCMQNKCDTHIRRWQRGAARHNAAAGLSRGMRLAMTAAVAAGRTEHQHTPRAHTASWHNITLATLPRGQRGANDTNARTGWRPAGRGDTGRPLCP